MVIAALICFAVLLIAWIWAPDRASAATSTNTSSAAPPEVELAPAA